jgi:hypothetical protein
MENVDKVSAKERSCTALLSITLTHKEQNYMERAILERHLGKK